MTDRSRLDDTLLANLLRFTEPPSDSEPSTYHLDENDLAEFCTGSADDETRTRVITHLDACPTCRQAASLWMSLEESESTNQESDVRREESGPVTLAMTSQLRVLAASWIAWATAACVLLATGTVFWFSPRMPTELALVHTGRLTDFGYEPGGVVARGPIAPAKQRANDAAPAPVQPDNPELTVLLNRGHGELTLGELHAARESFETARHMAPDNPWAALGLGLTDFLLDDFNGAERAFREALALDGHLAAARENLAMTLEELNRPEDALAEWQRLLSEPLSTDEREQVERQIDRLQSKP